MHQMKKQKNRPFQTARGSQVASTHYSERIGHEMARGVADAAITDGRIKTIDWDFRTYIHSMKSYFRIDKYPNLPALHEWEDTPV